MQSDEIGQDQCAVAVALLSLRRSTSNVPADCGSTVAKNDVARDPIVALVKIKTSLYSPHIMQLDDVPCYGFMDL